MSFEEGAPGRLQQIRLEECARVLACGNRVSCQYAFVRRAGGFVQGGLTSLILYRAMNRQSQSQGPVFRR